MVMDEIEDVLAKRRSELVEVLETKSHELQLEKQHQIYGAINEIDLFLQTITYYQKSSKDTDLGPIRLVKPPESKKGLFSRIFNDIKEKVKRNK